MKRTLQLSLRTRIRWGDFAFLNCFGEPIDGKIFRDRESAVGWFYGVLVPRYLSLYEPINLTLA